jgi:spermidine/putrescine ABC transporter ATP-binding subunit
VKSGRVTATGAVTSLATRQAGADLPAAVELAGVTKRFGNVTAADGVDLIVRQGQFFSLLGPSGGGKTTLLRIIGGFEIPDEGRVLLGGEDVTFMPANRRATALVFQHWALFPHMTVVENIAFGLRMRKFSKDRIKARTDELLDLVGLGGLGGRRPSQLSGGQQQRVALARCLAIEPVVLLLDEPLSALDLKLRSQMQDELKRLQREVGTTFLYVTHDQSEAMAMSDSLAIVNEGRLEQVGTPLELYDEPRSSFVATFVGEANLFQLTGGRKAGTGLLGDARINLPTAARCIAGEARLTLSVRPERVEIGSALDCSNVFPGVVRETTFTGPTVRYTVDVGSGMPSIVCRVPYQGTQHFYPAGTSVQVGWRADSAVIVAD